VTRGAVVGAGAGLVWLGASAFLSLIAVLASYFSIVGFVAIACWAAGSALLGFVLLFGRVRSWTNQASVVAAGGSALVAAWFALATPGSELMWSVVILCGIASFYSFVALRSSGGSV
jgi:hypothetical protein